jgi:hypothetical protein
LSWIGRPGNFGSFGPKMKRLARHEDNYMEKIWLSPQTALTLTLSRRERGQQ